MFHVTFPVTASCGSWSGDNDITIVLSDKDYAILQDAVAEAEEEGWPYLDEDGPCTVVFSRIINAVTELLDEAGVDYDPDDMEIMVGLPEETE